MMIPSCCNQSPTVPCARFQIPVRASHPFCRKLRCFFLDFSFPSEDSDSGFSLSLACCLMVLSLAFSTRRSSSSVGRLYSGTVERSYLSNSSNMVLRSLISSICSSVITAFSASSAGAFFLGLVPIPKSPPMPWKIPLIPEMRLPRIPPLLLCAGLALGASSFFCAAICSAVAGFVYFSSLERTSYACSSDLIQGCCMR